jgi:ElaA protein
MNWILKKFDELTSTELYAVMALREQVFTYEQKCTEQDFDFKDHKAWHLMAMDGDKLAAYARIFAPGDYHPKAASFGRLVVDPAYRGQGLGQIAINKSLEYIKANFNSPVVELSAQSYLRQFYQNKGFQDVGEEYDEGGIAHQKMVLSY